jgi:hypothetical protein
VNVKSVCFFLPSVNSLSSSRAASVAILPSASGAGLTQLGQGDQRIYRGRNKFHCISRNCSDVLPAPVPDDCIAWYSSPHSPSCAHSRHSGVTSEYSLDLANQRTTQRTPRSMAVSPDYRKLAGRSASHGKSQRSWDCTTQRVNVGFSTYPTLVRQRTDKYYSRY